MERVYDAQQRVMHDGVRACQPVGILIGRVLLCVAVFAILSARVALAEAEPPTLGLVWGGIDEDSMMATSWVTVYSGDKLVFRGETRFREPMVVGDVPPGRVKVVVLPKVSRTGEGYEGSTEVDMAKTGMTTARVPVTKSEGVRIAAIIRDVDGMPLKGTVKINDVTDKELQLMSSAETSEDGQLVFVGYIGRTYRIVVIRARHQILTYTSKPITAAKSMEPFTWQLDHGPILRLRFWIVINGDRRVADSPHVNFRPVPRPQTGMSAGMFQVKGSELELSKSQGLLADADAVKLTYVPQQESDSYVIAKNGRIALTKDEEQVVDVVLAAKATGTISVVVGGLGDTTQLKLRAIHADTKAAYALSVTDPTTLPAGQYTIRAWQEGYRLATHETAILKDKTASVKVDMNRAPLYRLQVLDHVGKPVAGAAVMPIYPAKLGIPRAAQETDRVGQVSVAIDDRLEAQLAVITPAMGARTVPLSPKWRDEVGKIELAAPCEAVGEVDLGKVLATGVREVGWSVIWVTAQRPRVVVYVSKMLDGKYSGILQPGEYIPYLVQANEAIALPAVSIGAGERKKTIKRVEIDAKEWRNRKTLGEHEIR